MRILELFAGSRSFSKVAQSMGHQSFASDIVDFDGIDYVTDIFDFDCAKIDFVPDIIWASPPCTCFSVASIGKHWLPGRIPKTESAQQSILIVKKTIEIIDALKPKFYFIENPRGMLRTLGILRNDEMKSVTYCAYGDERMKPTDIWTNSKIWTPKPMCKNGSPCHQSAPRGARSGTQGRKNAYERSKIPENLCKEIILSCI